MTDSGWLAQYGGSYLDEDGVLVINTVSRASDFQTAASAVIGDDHYHIKTVTYPLTYLKSIIDALNSHFNANPNAELTNQVTSYFLDERESSIVVEIEGMNDNNVKAFKKGIIDSPALSSRESAGRIEALVNINPGSRVTGTAASISVGFRVGAGGYTHIISAGHGFNSTGDYAYVSGTHIGHVMERL
jgi:hypothetical protein